MPNKILLSAGHMCDMTYVGEKGGAFIYFEDGHFCFDPDFFETWIQPLANKGIEMRRIALYCVGSELPRRVLFMPWKFVAEKDAWDLTAKNQEFFDILRQLVIKANSLKTRIMICVLNECEERNAIIKNGKVVDEGPRRKQSPFYHNINGIVGLYDRRALPVVSTLTDWILKAVEGTDFAIELINEGHRPSSGSTDTVNVIIPRLLAADVPPWWISLGADVRDTATKGFRDVSDWKTRWPNDPDKENYDLFIDRLHLVKYYDARYPKATNNVFFVCHSFATDPDEEFPKIFPFGRRTGYAKEAWIDRNLASNRVIFSTDGGRRPNAARMKAAMLYLINSNPRYKKSPMIDNKQKLLIDYLPEKQNTKQLEEIAQAMAEAYKEAFGAWPENYGNVPPTIPVPPIKSPDIIIDDDEEPDDKVVESLFNWRGEWNNNKAWIVGGIVGLIVAILLGFALC